MSKAVEILRAVKGKPLSLSDRIEKAIHLAGEIQETALTEQKHAEKQFGKELARMMKDPIGKCFTTELTDQAFRSSNPARSANQIHYLIDRFGVPQFLSLPKRLGMALFYYIGTFCSGVLVPLMQKVIRQETARVILPGEEKELIQHLRRRRAEGVRVNLNHLGEAILGEEEAANRLATYLADLKKPEVEYISVKISTLYSQINLIAWNETLEKLAERYRTLLREGNRHFFSPRPGIAIPKFINLDMEEYRDLRLTVALFKKVLAEEEFLKTSAGIVLQSYLPDSYPILKELTDFARERCLKGGSPLKVRIVKGANLAMERVEAALRGWEQAPYSFKHEVDANFKRMVHYAFEPDNAAALHVGIGSHNLFDIAYAMILREEREVAPYVVFEMLEGMADASRRVIQSICHEILLYCPAASAAEFQNALAYLVRRLDENTGPENYLRVSFELKPGTSAWQRQADLFASACEQADMPIAYPRRQQNRSRTDSIAVNRNHFENEADTDWCLPQNRKWAEAIQAEWEQKQNLIVPAVIAGKEMVDQLDLIGKDPSRPKWPLYKAHQCSAQDIEQAIVTASANQTEWSGRPVAKRVEILLNAAERFREMRGTLLGAMMANCGKPFMEGDPEISEAIDFIDYYARSLQEFNGMEGLQISAKGPTLVASPWNFPCSIPSGCISAALAAGNTVLFKPAPEAVLVGYELVKLFWDAGVPRQVLQFVPCEDKVASLMVIDKRIEVVLLTGATSTAKHLLGLRSDLDLCAETGGKNAIIVTALADRDLAVKEVIQSAFSFSGQKCSACSLLILEKEVYQDPHFKKQLLDAAKSLKSGSAWDPAVKVPPLIHPPAGALKNVLDRLESGQQWVLKPETNPDNPHLLSPGIIWGVQSGSYLHQTELFGPVLGVMCAENLDHAIEMVNQSPYGLTSGLQSLDEREQRHWRNQIIAGNLYINRTITGAIVERQPFGGCKASNFGRGLKAGGPNYLLSVMNIKDVFLPSESARVSPGVSVFGMRTNLNPDEKKQFEAACGSYAFYFKHYFSKEHDPLRIMGQDNIQCYESVPRVYLRVNPEDSLVDVLCTVAAYATCRTHVEISLSAPIDSIHFLHPIVETEEQFVLRLLKEQNPKVRLLSKSLTLSPLLAEAGIVSVPHPVVLNGRIELLNALREVSVSRDYHRYGYLGEREYELKAESLRMAEAAKKGCAEPSCCCKA